MKLKTAFSRNHCKDMIRENLSRVSLPFGFERYTGWYVLGFFSIAYHDGNELRRFYPIKNKILGYIKETHNQTHVIYKHFSGYTDFISFAIIFIFSLLLIMLANHEHNIGIGACLLFTGLYTSLVALFTYLATRLSKQGNSNRIKLESYLVSLLELYSD